MRQYTDFMLNTTFLGMYHIKREQADILKICVFRDLWRNEAAGEFNILLFLNMSLNDILWQMPGEQTRFT